jgi:L-alanine-DL-glutamate epimerase-like enolase superfamily enzyme
MRIAEIAVSHHRIDLDPPFPAAWDPVPRTSFTATIVRVRSDDGLEGIGSGDAMAGFSGHEHLFIGQDPRALARHARIIDNLSFHFGRCWPLDLALWDLVGKSLGQPVWRLLGGSSDRVPCYASTGTLREPAALAETAKALAERGFAAMKIRFHEPDWRREIGKVEAVRAAIGERMALMVDANQGWRMPWDSSPSWTLKDALACARALEPLGVHWLEEPLHRGDVEGMRRLRDLTPIRIAGGEMAREMHDLWRFVETGCLDILQPDATLVGGITLLAELARAARARGVRFTPHTWGNGIGQLANAQLVAGLGDPIWLEFPYDPPSWALEHRDFMLAAPLDVDAQGCMRLGEAPGLGIVLDEARLAATRIG